MKRILSQLSYCLFLLSLTVSASADHHNLDVSGIIQGIVEEQTIVRSADDNDKPA